MVNKFLRRASYALLPARCLHCGQASHRDLDLCRICETLLPWQQHSCQRCALPLADEHATVCGQCLSKPPAFSRCIAPWRYAMPVDDLVSGFKYRRHLHCGRLLAELALPHLQAAYDGTPFPDCLVPMPLHWRRLLSRRFNQSHYLAVDWSRALNLPLTDCLQRVYPTAPQQGQDKAARRRNVRNAFVPHRKAPPVADQCVALVDDVVTTGATADAAAHCLLQAGAREVHVWALARTP